MHKITLAHEVLLEEAASLLEEGREVVITPLGYSMLPFIRGGKDQVTLRKMPSVQVGDIALVRLPGQRYVLHRVINVDSDAVTLMGDGNLQEPSTAPSPTSWAPWWPSAGASGRSSPEKGSSGAESNLSDV